MKRTVVLGLLLLSWAFCDVKAQSSSTRVTRIEIHGKEVKKSYKVFFLSDDKWIEAERTPNGFVIPERLRSQEYLTILFALDKHKLVFSRIHISKFTEDWTVGIDTKPFSDEFVKPEEAGITKRAYYIKFQGYGLGTALVITEKKTR